VALPSKPAETTRVEVDASVVLKIVKHAYDQFPAQSAGHLLGLEQDSALSVSHCFPFPASATENDGSGLRSKAIQKYQTEVIDHLKEVNVDSNSVGWYISANMGRFYSQSVIDTMLAYQVENPESVVLVHDVARSAQAGFSLRAYRLSAGYIRAKKDGKFTTDNLVKNELSFSTIFDELPVDIHNSHLVTLYLHSAKQLQDEATKDYDKLNISIDSYLENNIDAIFESVDDFHYDQGNYNYYQRQMSREKIKIQQWQQKRKAENTAREASGKPLLPTDEWKSLFKLPDEPSRLDNLLISAQIDQYCTQIEEFGGAVTPKLFASQKVLEA
jgi:translation initiation factor 3 subunit H